MNKRMYAAIAVAAFALSLLGPVPASQARSSPFSGTVSSNGHTLTWALGGVAPATGDLVGRYDGVVQAGAPVTFSGSASFTIGKNFVTNLSQSASLTGATSMRFSQRVGEGTHTLPFDLTATAPNGTGSGVVGTMRAAVSSQNCNDWGVCGGPTVTFELAVVKLAAVISPTAAEGFIGTSVAFDAASSTAGIGRVTRFEWDVDGSGFQEGGPQFSHSWMTTGTKTVRVRVTGEGGDSDIATATVQIYRRSSQGPGLTINNAVPYTRDKNVTLTIGWPDRATQVTVSNDGGFAAATTRDVESQIPWTLDDTVTGSYTKVVYVRFSGPGIDSTRTYSDDIIFDNTAPTIQQVTVTQQRRTSQSLTAQSLATKVKSRVTVECTARDKVSGMKSIQVNTKKSARTASTKTYRAKVKIGLQSKVKKSIFVRVSDTAGNWTQWKKVNVNVHRR